MLIEVPLNLKAGVFEVLKRARVLSTRGIGEALIDEEVMLALREVPVIHAWMAKLLVEVRQ